VTYDETEIVADAGVRLRIIADGLLAAAESVRIANAVHEDSLAAAAGQHFMAVARHVDEVRVRLCALPIEAEGEAA